MLRTLEDGYVVNGGLTAKACNTLLRPQPPALTIFCVSHIGLFARSRRSGLAGSDAPAAVRRPDETSGRRPPASQGGRCQGDVIRLQYTAINTDCVLNIKLKSSVGISRWEQMCSFQYCACDFSLKSMIVNQRVDGSFSDTTSFVQSGLLLTSCAWYTDCCSTYTSNACASGAPHARARVIRTSTA